MPQLTYVTNLLARYRRAGFTIVEVLAIMVVLGILTSIALPRYGAARDKARLATVRSDVRNAQLAEEAYFADNGRYGDLAPLTADNLIRVSAGVALTVTASTSGFILSATDPAITMGPTTCAVRVGDGASSSIDGVMSCH